jgi:hypothetical protein
LFESGYWCESLMACLQVNRGSRSRHYTEFVLEKFRHFCFGGCFASLAAERTSMQLARKVFLKQVILTFVLAGICTFSACEKPSQTDLGAGHPPPIHAIAGACSETWSDTYCDSTNECDSGICTVNVVANGASATAKIQGQNPQSPKDKIICVKPGASLLWQAPASSMGAPNQFIGDFGGISPWQSARAYVLGGGSTSDTETAVSSTTKCYKYDLYVCNSAGSATAAVSCGVDDPKIIVGN